MNKLIAFPLVVMIIILVFKYYPVLFNRPKVSFTANYMAILKARGINSLEQAKKLYDTIEVDISHLKKTNDGDFPDKLFGCGRVLDLVEAKVKPNSLELLKFEKLQCKILALAFEAQPTKHPTLEGFHFYESILKEFPSDMLDVWIKSGSRFKLSYFDNNQLTLVEDAPNKSEEDRNTILISLLGQADFLQNGEEQVAVKVDYLFDSDPHFRPGGDLYFLQRRQDGIVFQSVAHY